MANPTPLKLRVRANVRPDGTFPMVQDYKAMMAGTRRFVGARHNPELGVAFKDPVDGTVKMSGGFEAKDEPEELSATDEYAGEYLRHLRDGDLLPADEETARYARVPWTPAPEASTRMPSSRGKKDD